MGAEIKGPVIFGQLVFEHWPPEKAEIRCANAAVWNALDGIIQVLNDAVKRYPDETWPKDVVHMTAIMMEEAGEAVQAANDAVHKGKSVHHLRNELMQTAAMCIRCLVHLEDRA